MPTDDSQNFENTNIYFYQDDKEDFFTNHHSYVIWILYILVP